MNTNQINVISNNVNSTKKRLKMMQYFKNMLLPYSFNKPTPLKLMKLVGLSSSYGALIGFLGHYDVNVLNQMSDNKGRILILSA